MTTPRDERPRPQYGEYATPEQQRAAIREPLPEIVVEAVAPPQLPAQPVVTGAAIPAAGRPVPADRVITLIMLALGAVTVLLVGLPMAVFSQMLPATLESVGISSELANVARSPWWDYALSLIWIGGFALTAYFSLRRIRARRLSWWIPIVGALVTGLIFNIVASLAYGNDPGLMAYMDLILSGTPFPTPTP